MCGIIAVIGRPAGRRPPTIAEIGAELRAASGHLAPAVDGGAELLVALAEAATHVERADAVLRGATGVRALVGEPAGIAELSARIADLQALIERLDQQLDDDGRGLTPLALEAVNTELVRLKDALWALGDDRLRTVRAVAELAGDQATGAALMPATAVQIAALSAIDRLEVRGRDSAGLHLLVRGHVLDLADPTVLRLLGERSDDPLFRSGSVRVPAGHVAFVYKAAAEIGELGDNTAVIRAEMRDDVLLHLALANETARVVVLGHTRWASVGIISKRTRIHSTPKSSAVTRRRT